MPAAFFADVDLMTGYTPIRIIRHEAVPQTGSFEVRFSGGRPSKFFHWDDIPERRVRSDQLDSNQAREEAIRFARSKRREFEV